MQWSTVPNNKKKIRIWYPSLITRNSSRARQPLSRVNVTELLLRLLVKIGNIYLFKIIIKIKNMETSLKTGFAQIFSCCPKNLSCPNFGGAAAPLAPPASTPMLSGQWWGWIALASTAFGKSCWPFILEIRAPVFYWHATENKNQNRSIDYVQNLGNERRLI